MLCAENVRGILEAVQQEEMLCDEVETVSESTYLGNWVSVGGEFEAAVTARIRYGLVNLRECGELLHGRRFPLQLKGAVHKRYVRPAILHGSEVWCLK